MGTSFPPIIGGLVGGLALLLVTIAIAWFCLSRCRSFSKRNSDTGSSAPSIVDVKRGGSSSLAGPSEARLQEARQFRLEDLQQATKNFSESNLIGFGSFGMVFKGLLCDGTVVAVKRHIGAPCHEFVQQVSILSRIQHRSLVNLEGFCQDNGYQILVYEYLPNGSISNHLYDTGKDEATKLDFKQRLSIGVGAAKGLSYLHARSPPVAHGNFKTANVLVDENFIAKVADAGIANLLEKIEDAGPSSSSGLNPFRDPEVVQTGTVCEASDVYSFGIFLLELITGKETSNIEAFGSNGSIVQWVEEHLQSSDLVDNRLIGSFTTEGMRDCIKLILQCTTLPGRLRPTMEMAATELEQILEKEIMLTTITVESSATVTLGSQLFTK